MKNVQLEGVAYDQFIQWYQEDKEIFEKIDRLIRDISRTPFEGLGKPEPLKYEWKGFWSRRITDEHRLVYRVTNEEIIVIQCRFHYSEK